MNTSRETVKLATMATLLACSLWSAASSAQSAQEQQASSAAPGTARASAGKSSRYQPVKIPKHARTFYQAYGGVDNLTVRQTASGNLIRFSYRVTDPARAKALGEKNVTPYMIGQRSHALLQIPVMDKIGQLRQTGTPEIGQEYWMVFSNKGNLIKAGDRVNVTIGSAHFDGLVVE
ncbi:hypothetical protein SAMN04515618_115134 [Collimonas sp. OK307]|uniref:hypothetical protein n=1 Tax=Collimonas sp. OK307 TaxID=1801620 RepID=UPI0008DF1478|nr:hypothetical protein [Collimonas sp. OK307]SFI27375.1 hypothetical protein SAMN04515618_115134 [Collimonas sp. OK307]